MNYYKNTDSSKPPQRENRKQLVNTALVLLSKHGFGTEVPDLPPEPVAAPPPASGVSVKRKRER